jgi:hypothetical protein
MGGQQVALRGQSVARAYRSVQSPGVRGIVVTVTLAVVLGACSGSSSATPGASVPSGAAATASTSAGGASSTAPAYPFGGDACQALTDAEITAATGLTPTSHDTTTASGRTGGPHCYWHLPAASGQNVLAVEFGDIEYFTSSMESNGGRRSLRCLRSATRRTSPRMSTRTSRSGTVRTPSG